MRRLIRFVAERPHLFLLLIYPLLGLGFAYCEAAVPVPKFVMEWPGVDRSIPFVPFMIVPYLFWYAAVAFPLFWLGLRKDGREFRRYAWFLYGGMASTYVIYLLFPNGETLRPSLAGMTGWDIDAIRWVYTHDTPENVCPSLHVIDTMAVWYALTRDRVLAARPWFIPLLAVICVSIIASTMLVKQHSVFDVIAGFAWSGLWWVIVYAGRRSAE